MLRSVLLDRGQQLAVEIFQGVEVDFRLGLVPEQAARVLGGSGRGVGLGLFLGVMAWQMLDVTSQIGQSDGYTQWAFVASFLGLMLFLIMAMTDNPILYNLWFMNPLFAVMGAAYGVARNRGCPSDDAARAGQVRIG